MMHTRESVQIELRNVRAIQREIHLHVLMRSEKLSGLSVHPGYNAGSESLEWLEAILALEGPHPLLYEIWSELCQRPEDLLVYRVFIYH